MSRKNITSVLIFIIMSFLMLSSCSYPNATDFEEAPAKTTIINQSYNNKENDILYFDRRIYCDVYYNYVHQGIFTAGEKGIKCLYKSSDVLGVREPLWIEKDKLFFRVDEDIDDDTYEVYQVNGYNKKLVATEPCDSPKDIDNVPSYNTERLKIYSVTGKKDKTDLKIERKGDSPYMLSTKFSDADFSVDSFCIDGEDLFFLTQSDSLYLFNIKSKNKPKRLCYLEYADELLFSDGYIYYNSDGLKRFNVSTKSSEDIIDKSINLSYLLNGKAYFCTDSGIYSADKESGAKKILDINVFSVYNYGEKYLYFNSPNGCVYQLRLKDNEIKMIPFFGSLLKNNNNE